MSINTIDLLNNSEKKFMKEMVSAVNRAIVEDVSDDYQRSGLDRQHSNSYNQLIWDHINNNLSHIADEHIIGGYTKRGFWNVYSIFDTQTGYIYSFMREKRFFQIAKEYRKNPHYITALASECNSTLKPRQMTFFPIEPDKAEMKAIVECICNDLSIPFEIIKGHKMILFDTKHGILSSIRCCIVDRTLEIHDSIELTSYININESVIIEEVDDLATKRNNPTLGLKLKDKAKKKKELNDNIVLADNHKEERKIK